MADHTDLNGLIEPLGLGSHEHIALVGGGGKTTLLHALGRSLNGTRVLTTTTKMAAEQHETLPVLLAPTDHDLLAAVRHGPVVVWSANRSNKAAGISPERCDELFQLVDHVLVEADGSRHLPFKAPGPFEPVVPTTTTMLISVMGAQALGKVIADICHRPLRVAALAGCSPYQRLSPAAAAAVLTHPDGLLRAAPARARVATAITQPHTSDPGLLSELLDRLGQLNPEHPVLVIDDSG